MSFLWTRSTGAVTSRCTLCGMTTRSLSESAIYATQRGHDAMTCQRRRAEAARVVEPEDDVERCPDGHERAGNTRVDGRGHLVCNACRREKYAAKKSSATQAETPTFARVLAHGWTKIKEQSETAPSVNSKPPLDTPVEGASK